MYRSDPKTLLEEFARIRQQEQAKRSTLKEDMQVAKDALFDSMGRRLPKTR